jgi:hypothetical protein
MTSVAIGFIVFACCFGGALFGMFLSTRLPEQHLSGDSKNIVNLGMGLVGTMTALVHQFSDWGSGVARLLAGCFVAHRSKTTAGILPLNASPARTFAHPAKIRSGATTPVTDLVH